MKAAPSAEHPRSQPWSENTQINAPGLDPGAHALCIGSRAESINQEPNLYAA
jgi:hypothetical protein